MCSEATFRDMLLPSPCNRNGYISYNYKKKAYLDETYQTINSSYYKRQNFENLAPLKLGTDKHVIR